MYSKRSTQTAPWQTACSSAIVEMRLFVRCWRPSTFPATVFGDIYVSEELTGHTCTEHKLNTTPRVGTYHIRWTVTVRNAGTVRLICSGPPVVGRMRPQAVGEFTGGVGRHVCAGRVHQ